MLTARGWWFFLLVLALLALGIFSGAGTVSLLALTLLTWFLGQWLSFLSRHRVMQRSLSLQRELTDERGVLQTLWARLPVTVRISLHCNPGLSFGFISMIDRVPLLAQRREGDWFADGPLDSDAPLTAAYRIECPAPGRLRFDGVKLRSVDLHGFFVHQLFIRDPKVYRVLPALGDARGHIPAVKRHNLIPLMGNHPHRRPGSSSELLELRDYLPGDPPKRIAWKASARRDRLMTKEFESEVPVRCTLFVDTSTSVRVGAVGRNALTRVVEIAAAVAQANASARDLTGLCLFDEDGIRRLVRPGRGSTHLVQLTNLLADAAGLLPRSDHVPLDRLLPLAYGVLQDMYPDWLDNEVNSWPFWLPFWSPQPWYTIPGPRWKARWWWAWPVVELLRLCFVRVRPWKVLGNLVGLFSPRLYRWRKKIAAFLSVRHRLGPGGLALLLEDDAACRRHVQHFLNEHQVPCPLPYYDEQGRYLFGAPGKIGGLTEALTQAVSRGRDNELFVLLVDLLETGPHLEQLLRVVRVALGRHHQVLVVCPWPPGVEVPTRRQGQHSPSQRTSLNLQDLLAQASTRRIQQAFAHVQQAFARLRVPVLCAPDEETVALILHRLHRLRVRERGVR